MRKGFSFVLVLLFVAASIFAQGYNPNGVYPPYDIGKCQNMQNASKEWLLKQFMVSIKMNVEDFPDSPVSKTLRQGYDPYSGN